MPSTEEKLLLNNFDQPILEYYQGHFEYCFVILHPFYKQIFDEDYDEFANYKLTHPLIENISWEEIMKATGIKSLSKLALTITYPACSREYQELVKHEWNEFAPFLEDNKINCCYWAEDEIPKDILLAFFDFLLGSGYHSIKVGYWAVFDEQVETHQLTHENKYDSAVRFAKNNFVLSPDNKFCLKLPYHDLPYTFLLTNNVSAKEIADKLGYEGFEADKKTQPYWHVTNYSPLL